MGDVQEKRKEVGRGGIRTEGVQVCAGRCVQIRAGKRPGEEERLGHNCRDRIPAEGSRGGPCVRDYK